MKVTKKQYIYEQVRSFNHQGVGVTRQTLVGSTDFPINTICTSVASLIKDGWLTENGCVPHNGRQRSLLYTVAFDKVMNK